MVCPSPQHKVVQACQLSCMPIDLFLCRFFMRMEDYEFETRFYEQQLYRSCLPDIVQAYDNRDGAVVSRSGHPFPPFMILDRGITLQDWLKVERSMSAVLAMAAVSFVPVVVVAAISYRLIETPPLKMRVSYYQHPAKTALPTEQAAP